MTGHARIKFTSEMEGALGSLTHFLAGVSGHGIGVHEEIAGHKLDWPDRVHEGEWWAGRCVLPALRRAAAVDPNEHARG